MILCASNILNCRQLFDNLSYQRPHSAHFSGAETSTMASLDLQLRFLREVTDLDIPCREENLVHQELHWHLPVEQTALVLVDCWRDYLLDGYVQRTAEICENFILPAVQACREAGVTVIHAPSDEWMHNYAPWRKYADTPKPGEANTAWPPREFRFRTGDFADFEVPRTGREPGYLAWCEKVPEEKRYVADCLAPAPDDIVVADAPELVALCEDRKIFHLLYAGFATNVCIQNRCYGMRPMRDRGYNTILLRDGTAAIESAETIGELRRTQDAILEIEMKVGASTTCAELQRACQAVSAS